MKKHFYTIGYEGASVEDFVETLRQAGIERLIDIRDYPGSRKKGFSKNILAQILELYDIEYVHLKGLGDPKEGREAARAGDYPLFKKIFAKHMKTTAAKEDLKKAIELIKDSTSCLFCYERAHKECHRNIVGAKITEKTKFKQENIGVMQGCGEDLEYIQEQLYADVA